MSGLRNNQFSVCMQGIGEVYVLGLCLVVTLTLGSFLGVLIIERHVVKPSTLMYLLFFGGFIVGIFQVWGIISYTLIAFQVVALFQVDSQRWLILLALLLTQTSETSRMLLNYQDGNPWLHALAFAGVLLTPILCTLAYYLLNRDTVSEEPPYTDCRSCGYNLTGTLRGQRSECPECGHPVSDYQRIQSNLDQHKHAG